MISALRAAELAERAAEQGMFWKAHVALMTRSADLREEDLDTIARELNLPTKSSPAGKRAARRVRGHARAAEAAGVPFDPDFLCERPFV